MHLLAAAVLLSEHVLPYPTARSSLEAVAAQLSQLAALVAAAVPPAGHCLELDADLVCFQRLSDGVEVKLSAPFVEAGGSWEVAADADAVHARMAPPPAQSCWPAALWALGHVPEGSTPNLRVTVQAPA